MNQDLNYVEQMSDTLDKYLVTDGMYWKLSQVPFAGTIGGTLLRRKRLRATDAFPEQLKQANTTFETKADELKSQFDDKLQREINLRLNNTAQFIQDCIANPLLCGDYPVWVKERVILELILVDYPNAATAAQIERSKQVDQQLRAISSLSGFRWEAQYEQAFKKERYWMLYIQPDPERIAALGG